MKKLALVVLILFVGLGNCLANNVTLAWDFNEAPPDGYRLYKKQEGGEYQLVTFSMYQNGDIPPTVNQVTVTGLPDDKFYFVVRAFVGAEMSANSNEVYAILPFTEIPFINLNPPDHIYRIPPPQ